MGIAYVGRAWTIDGFRKYVSETDLGPYSGIFVHHTASPTEDQWNGKETLDNIFSLYESWGWSAGPNLFVGPDFIWEATPVTQDGIGVAGYNFETRHIETVGNYMYHMPSGKILEQVIAATGILLQKPTPLDVDAILQHRWYNQTSCPGDMWSANWDWFRVEVGKYMAAHPLGGSAQPVEENDAVARTIREFAWNYMQISYNEDAALLKMARKLGSGAPLANENDVTIGGLTYRVQPFARDILYCEVGHWDAVKRIEW